MAKYLVLRQSFSVNAASKATETPRTSLRRRLRKPKAPCGAPKVFSADQEVVLADEIRKLPFGKYFLLKHVLQHVYKFGQKTIGSKSLPPAWERNEKAGVEWWKSFKKKHDLNASFFKGVIRCPSCGLDFRSVTVEFLQCQLCEKIVCQNCFEELFTCNICNLS